MRVDAAAAASPSPSSTTPDTTLLYLVVVATLVSIALLTFSLRVYTCGKLPRTFGIDDWSALVAGLSTIGVITIFACLVNLGSGKSSQAEQFARTRASRSHIWLWILSLFHIVGMGFIKLSVTAYLLRVFERRYCCHLLYGLAGVLIASTFAWFGSVLLRCLPVTAGWDLYNHPGARCIPSSTYATLDFANNAINAGTDVFIAILLIPIICGPTAKFTVRAYLTVVLCLGVIACTAAIIRTHEVHEYWKNGQHTRTHNLIFTVWSIIELTTALTASCIPTLVPLITSLFSKPANNIPTPYSTTHSPSSSHTVIYRPATAHLPSASTSTLTRYHDSISHLDFDIETRTTRSHTRSHTRTQTLGSRSAHSRNVSDWSQFSGFTYYTDPAVPPDVEMQARGVSVTELEEIVKGLGLGGRGSVESVDERGSDGENVNGGTMHAV